MTSKSELSKLFAHPGVLVDKVLPSIVIVVIGWLLIRTIHGWFRRMLRDKGHRLRLKAETEQIASRLLLGLLWVILLVVLLRFWGVDLSVLWTTLVGILAVISVGFLASWSMISNISAHFFSWVWRPFHIGQEIQLVQLNVRGEVVSTNLMFTELREEDGHSLLVPNNFFFQNIIRLAPLREPADGPRKPRHGR